MMKESHFIVSRVKKISTYVRMYVHVCVCSYAAITSSMGERLK